MQDDIDRNVNQPPKNINFNKTEKYGEDRDKDLYINFNKTEKSGADRDKDLLNSSHEYFKQKIMERNKPESARHLDLKEKYEQ